MIRIWFFWTPELAKAVLKHLVESPEFEVRYAVTQPDKPVGRHAEMTKSPVRAFAEEAGIPVFTPEKIRGNADFMQQVSAMEVDYLIVVAYGKILPNDVLELPKRLPINVHGSLLPKYRGASPIQAALLAGEKETGVTIMVMGEKMDEGDILTMTPIAISEKETSGTLFAKFAEISPKALADAVVREWNGELARIVQDHPLATYCTKITKEDGKMDFEGTAIEAFRKWQAYTPWPGIWCELEGKRCKVLDCEPVSVSEKLAPGECMLVNGEAIVGFREGALKLVVIQLEWKTPADPVQFIRSRWGTAHFA